MLHHTPPSLPHTCNSTLTASVSTTSSHKTTCRRLPSILIDFIAITLCDLLPVKHNLSRRKSSTSFSSSSSSPSSFSSSLPSIRGRPLPELVYFIQKITFAAEINVRTMLVALIYLDRAKSRLSKNAVGSYDTSHRLLLGSLLIASKFLQGTTWTKSTLTNHLVYELCDGLFDLHEIDQMERALLKLIQYQCWIDDRHVNDFVLYHRVDLGL